MLVVWNRSLNHASVRRRVRHNDARNAFFFHDRAVTLEQLASYDFSLEELVVDFNCVTPAFHLALKFLLSILDVLVHKLLLHGHESARW